MNGHYFINDGEMTSCVYCGCSAEAERDLLCISELDSYERESAVKRATKGRLYADGDRDTVILP